MRVAGLAATFLGHQSWLISTGDTHVLVDPLLGDRFGHGGSLGLPYPPRSIALERMPPISAVLISHEHDDHFDPPSLARLPRTTPIYLPRRTSSAAWTILAELGFATHALEPGGVVEIGELRHRSVEVPAHARGGGDEWEVSPFVICDRDGTNSFASTVDLPAGDGIIDALARVCPRPGLWTYANNTSYSGYQDARARHPPSAGDDELLADIIAARHDRLAQRWAAPALSLVCGSGWCFTGARAWMNHNHFPIDGARLCERLEQLRPGASFVAPTPGQRLLLRDGELAGREHASFVSTPPRERWPDRSFVGDVVRMPEDYAPACGRRTLEQAELAQLLTALDEFAAYLYGGPVFAAVCALPSTLADGRQATFCLALRDADRSITLAYDPSACGFVRADHLAFASGLECWAGDLLALLRGELSPSALCFAGRMRYWNVEPTRLRISPSELWRFGHPLRRPRQTLALYRRLLAPAADHHR